MPEDWLAVAIGTIPGEAEPGLGELERGFERHMPTEHMKLVRDRIPEIIRAEGRTCQVESLPLPQYRQALLLKVVEEASEVTHATPDALAVEIADLLEVIDATMAAFGLDPETVRAVQKQRRGERGGFEKRLKLLWTD